MPLPRVSQVHGNLSLWKVYHCEFSWLLWLGCQLANLTLTNWGQAQQMQILPQSEMGARALDDEHVDVEVHQRHTLQMSLLWSYASSGGDRLFWCCPLLAVVGLVAPAMILVGTLILRVLVAQVKLQQLNDKCEKNSQGFDDIWPASGKAAKSLNNSIDTAGQPYGTWVLSARFIDATYLPWSLLHFWPSGLTLSKEVHSEC